MALVLAACSNQDEPMGEQLDSPVAAEFSAEIGEPISRAHDASWESGDAIGISGGGYNNKKYITATGNGNFTHLGFMVDDGNGIYFQNTSNVTFTAYYPFSGSENTSRGNISTSTSDQSANKTFDFLWAQASANYQSPTVKFNFMHKMTRLILQLKTDANAGFSASDVSSGTYKLSGIKHSGTFNTSTGTATATGTATNDWTINATATTASNVRTYSLIFFPQSGSKLTLTATIGDQDYTCDFTPGLAAGTSYTYTITMKKNGLEVSNATITNWATGTSGSGTATPTDPFNGHTAVLMREATETTPALYVAEMNVGATSSQYPGYYFWWGDVSGVQAAGSFNFAIGNSTIKTTYKTPAELYSAGITDNATDYLASLNPQYDAAHVIMGGKWRIPTANELSWLMNNCTWTWQTSPVKGHTVKSKTTGGEIFLPANGYIEGYSKQDTEVGYYWSSTPREDEGYANKLSNKSNGKSTGPGAVYRGYNIRAVLTK